MIYGESGMLKRAQKLAARARCDKKWGDQSWRGFIDRHTHSCKRYRRHASRECRCECGATKRRGVQ